MKWMICADSSCDLRTNDIVCPEVGFETVPFSLRIADQEYVDEENMDISAMLTAMENCPDVCRSSCPAPEIWAQSYAKAEQVLAITISSNLSGSYNSAVSAWNNVLEADPQKKITVLDSRSTGPESALCITHMAQWIRQGHSFEEVQEKAQAFLDQCKTIFALCSFDNLVKNGRMGRFTGFIARTLGMWGIGIASDEGTIIIKGKSKGAIRAIRLILDDMKERGFTGGEVAISHCMNEEMAEKLKECILQHWHAASVRIMSTRGLDSFYAERGGLIVAYR